ncbi:hypothetical protein ACFOYZ_16690 [Neobacillus cucumis]
MKKVINMINSSSKVAGVSLLELKKQKKYLVLFFLMNSKNFF